MALSEAAKGRWEKMKVLLTKADKESPRVDRLDTILAI